MKRWLALLAVLALVVAACGDSGTDETTTQPPADTGVTDTTAAPPPETTVAEAEEFVFGMILDGPQNDRGWSQAHFEGGQYVEENVPGARMLVVDKVNPADRPGVTADQVARDMIDQGAQLVFFTSDDMKDGALLAAEQNPDTPMIWSSGDSAWEDGKDYRADLANLGNAMGRMEFGKMIAGCAAALKSESGTIGYLGPLINDETRRLVNSAYLGVRYCWENYEEQDPATLDFSVNWIGFWFNIPGVTLDPTQVTNEFFDGGADVVISGIDTTEALVRAGQRAAADENVWAVPYDYEDACAEAPSICLGVPFFNWGPTYKEIAESVIAGEFEADWEWFGPDWADLNNLDTTGVGFEFGEGLTEDELAQLQEFVDGLASGDINLFTGPLNWQDGTEFLADGEEASDFDVWYAEQLLEGIEGASSS